MTDTPNLCWIHLLGVDSVFPYLNFRVFSSKKKNVIKEVMYLYCSLHMRNINYTLIMSSAKKKIIKQENTAVKKFHITEKYE